MRRLLLLIPLLAACAGRAQTSTIPTTGSFVDALPTDALAYLAIDVAQLRDDPEFATLFAPRLGEASASEQALFRGVFASVDSIAVAVMPRAGDIPSPIVGIVHTSMDTAAVAALAEASGARITRQARDGHDVLALSMGGAQTIDAVACEAGRFVVGVGVDVVAACEGFPRTTAGPAFARVVAEYARTPRSAIIHTLDAPCGTEVLEPYLLAGTKAQAPSDVRFGLCAMSLSFAFGDGLDVAGELVFDDVLRLAEFERMLAQLLRGLGDRYTRALAPLRASLATRPTNGERAFTVDFTEADVADMITMRAQLMHTRASDEMRFDTSMAEVFAAIDARLVWRAEPPHDTLVRTGDAPKGLLLYLPDADEGTDVPENVLALARAATLDVLVVEPTVRLATGAAWSESYVRDTARVTDAVARATDAGLVTDATRYVLVGHGQGGGVALEIASRRPTEIAAVIAIDPSALHPLPLLEGVRRVGVGVGLLRTDDGTKSRAYTARLEALRTIVIVDDGDALENVRAAIPASRGLFRRGEGAVGTGCEARGGDTCMTDAARAPNAAAAAELYLRACRAGVRDACSEARVRLSHLGPARVVNEAALRRLLAYQYCASGRASACVLHTLPGEELAARLAIAHDRCEAGDGAGCEAVSLALAGRPSGTEAADARLRGYAARGCEADDAASCTRLLHGANEADAIGYARRACALGEAEGCAHLAMLARTTGSIAEADLALLRTACFEEDDARVCGALGIVLMKVAHEADGGVIDAALEVGCEAPDALACYVLGMRRLAPVGADAGRAAGLFETACERGEARACVVLADLHRDGRLGRDLDEAATLDAAACGLRDPDGCRRFLRALERAEADAFEQTELRETLTSACDIELSAACVRLAAMPPEVRDLDGHDVFRRIGLERRACKLGDEAACARGAALEGGLATTAH